MCVAPVKVVDIADVAKQGVFILGAQSCTGLVADALQVVLKEMRKKAVEIKKHLKCIYKFCLQG